MIKVSYRLSKLGFYEARAKAYKTETGYNPVSEIRTLFDIAGMDEKNEFCCLIKSDFYKPNIPTYYIVYGSCGRELFFKATNLKECKKWIYDKINGLDKLQTKLIA